MLALTLLATTYSTGFEAVKSIETPSTNPYWQPGAGLTRVRPAIGPAVFDVTQYGAVGDNIHDDTKAIQTALDECVKSHDGGVVRASVHTPPCLHTVCSHLVFVFQGAPPQQEGALQHSSCCWSR